MVEVQEKRGVYFAFDNQTGNSRSLKTRGMPHAQRLVDAMNEADREAGIRKQVGLIYLTAADSLTTKAQEPALHFSDGHFSFVKTLSPPRRFTVI